MSDEKTAVAVADQRRFLVPRWDFRHADQFNPVEWSFAWLCLHVWSAGTPHVGIRIELDHELRFQIHLPYMHAALIVPVFPLSLWYGPLCRRGVKP